MSHTATDKPQKGKAMYGDNYTLKEWMLILAWGFKFGLVFFFWCAVGTLFIMSPVIIMVMLGIK